LKGTQSILFLRSLIKFANLRPKMSHGYSLQGIKELENELVLSNKITSTVNWRNLKVQYA